MDEKKILIVDYEKKSLDALEKTFSQSHLQVLTAMDGEAAYESFLRENPDIILLEPMLPKLHGFELAKKIREDSEGQTPIIIITGLYKGSQYRNEYVQTLGVAGYFEKPYDEQELLAAVMNIVREEQAIEDDLPEAENIFQTLVEMADTVTEEKNS